MCPYYVIARHLYNLMGLGINDDIIQPVHTTGKFVFYPESSFNYYFWQEIQMYYFHKASPFDIAYKSQFNASKTTGDS